MLLLNDKILSAESEKVGIKTTSVFTFCVVPTVTVMMMMIFLFFVRFSIWISFHWICLRALFLLGDVQKAHFPTKSFQTENEIHMIKLRVSTVHRFCLVQLFPTPTSLLIGTKSLCLLSL
jgi:hypothetical protein